MLPTVVQVFPTNDFKVYVYFADGKIKLYDASHLVGKGVFKQISDIEIFKDCCTVINGTLAWTPDRSFSEKTCLDLDPENLYLQSKDITDPLTEESAA